MVNAKPMPDTELELKLQVRSEDLPRLRRAPLFGAGRGVTRTVDSVYFDTVDLQLFHWNTTLRVCKQGRHYVQTVKTAAAHIGGAARRGEWESALSSNEPDIAAIAEGTGNDQIGRLAQGQMRPVFASHIRRTIRRVGDVGNASHAVIEVAFDEGEIRTPAGAALPVSGAELKGADPRALYDLALALSEIAPLRIEYRSMPERGYALVDASRAPTTAPPTKLAPDMTVEGALDAIVRQCLHDLAANEDIILHVEDAAALHQMRVALRRLRSALSLFRRMLPAAQYGFFIGEIKWLAGALSAAREWDVFVGELVGPVRSYFPQDASLLVLERAAGARRVLAYETARAAIASPRYTILLLKIGAWLEGRDWRQQPISEHSALLFEPVLELADRLLAQRRKRVLKRGAHFADQAPARRHELRIALKKLRYATEFFRSLYDKKSVRRYLRQLTGLQSALGHINDFAAANRLFAELNGDGGEPAAAGWDEAVGKVIGWHARTLSECEPRICADWKEFAKVAPFWGASR
jgi:inorganic triphosphatase YgiF